MDSKIAAFKPALIIVDVQEDFCPPNGTLAVPNGRAILPTITHLLTLPFGVKIATKDWHPRDHISFASNHAGKRPFIDFATVINPGNSEETYETRLWPDHCVQGTPGAELVSELQQFQQKEKGDLLVIEKGMRKEVEMYSAFFDPLKRPRVCDSGLAGVLREKGVTDVYVVGLAFDYCVRATAVDSLAEGFVTWVVREGTRAVDEGVWGVVERELEERGVRVVEVDGEEVRKVMEREL